MKIADYGKAITSYIESPTTAQKIISKTKVNTSNRTLLAEGTTPKEKPFTLDQFKDKANIYVGALFNNALPLMDIKSALNKFTTKGIEDGTFTANEAIKVVQDLRSSYRDLAQKQRLRGVIKEVEDREEFSEGGIDFSGLSVPQLRLLYRRYTGVDGPNDSRQLIRELKRLIKGLDEDGIPFSEGGRAKLAVGALPFIPTAVAAARPLVGPLVRKGAEVIGGTALGKRLSDTFFSKDKDEEKKKKDADPDDKNILKRPDPLDPKNLEDLATSIEIAEAVDRLKKKEMNPDKRDVRTKLAVDLDLPVTRSGLYEIRKDEDYFSKRLQTLKDKGVNFDGYYSSREIANLLGLKTGSGVNDFINRIDVPKVKSGLYSVVKLNDFLDAYNPTKERIQKAPELDVRTKARDNFISEAAKGDFYNRFKKLRQPKFLPTKVKEVYDKYNLSEIEGGHPFPVEFFTKKYGKGNTLQKDRQFDWIYRNKDKLFDKNNLVFQSKDVNTLFRNSINQLKEQYEILSPLVDKYEGKGAVKNKKDAAIIEAANNKIMRIVAESETNAKKFIEDSPNSVDLPRMRQGGLHGALFNTDTGEVSVYTGAGEGAGFVSGAAGDEPQDIKLKLSGDYLDIINQVITDEGDKKNIYRFYRSKNFTKISKGGTSIWQIRETNRRAILKPICCRLNQGQHHRG